MRPLACALLCSTMLWGCGSGSAALTDADRNDIRAADQKYVDADAKRDTDAMMSLLAEGVVFMPPGSQPLVGRESVRALFKLHPWDKLAETPAEIEGRADFAIVRGAYTGMAQGMPLSGSYVEVWQKQPDGAWRVTRKIWNSDRQ
jgi:ketosteroid isomerase-like protein